MSFQIEGDVLIGENSELELQATHLLRYGGFFNGRAVDTLSIEEVSQEDLETAVFVGANLDSIIDPHEIAEVSDLVHRVRNILRILDEKQQIILKRRFKIDGSKEDTLKEIGVSFPIPITVERVRQLQAKAFRKLRNRNVSASILIYGIDRDVGEVVEDVIK